MAKAKKKKGTKPMSKEEFRKLSWDKKADLIAKAFVKALNTPSAHDKSN